MDSASSRPLETVRHSEETEARAADIACEFSEILTAVIGYTELSLGEIQKGTALHDNLSRVLGAANQARNLVKQMLAPALTETLQSKPVSAAPRAKRATMPTGTECIFRVGADPSIAEMQQQLLERLGYKVIIRTRGMDAVEAFQRNQNKFDIVIVDPNLPDLSGDQLAREVKKIRPEIPVLMHADPTPGADAPSQGSHADGCLTKPASQAEMAKAVRSALDNAKNRNQI